MKHIFYLFLIVFSLKTHSQLGPEKIQSQIISPKELEMIETEVTQKLKFNQLDDSKKFLINILAGRELYQYRFYDKAKIYYQSALQLDVPDNKSEAYINLMAISIVEGNKAKLKDIYEQAKKYYSQNASYKGKEITYYLKTIESYLTGKGIIDGYYGQFAEETNVINLIKNKEYLKALANLNPKGIKKSKNNFNIIVYDALNVAVNKKKVKELNCLEDLIKYPKAYTYSTLLCGLLSDYLSAGSFDEKRLKRARTYFAEENQDKKYLFDMVEELR